MTPSHRRTLRWHPLPQGTHCASALPSFCVCLLKNDPSLEAKNNIASHQRQGLLASPLVFVLRLSPSHLSR